MQDTPNAPGLHVLASHGERIAMRLCLNRPWPDTPFIDRLYRWHEREDVRVEDMPNGEVVPAEA